MTYNHVFNLNTNTVIFIIIAVTEKEIDKIKNAHYYL